MINAKTVQDQIAVTASTSSQWSLIWQGFRRHRLGMIGLVTLSLMVLAVIFVPIIFPNPYASVNPDPSMWTAPIGTVDRATGHTFLLGSDRLGRDNLALIFQGGRLSLIVAFVPTVLIIVIGFTVGVIAGYRGGWVDSLLMRVADFLIALPLLPAYIISIRLVRASSRSAPLGDDVLGTMLALIIVFVLFGWMGVSRLVRGLVLSLRGQPFVEAARALGASTWRIMFRHLLPNAVAPLIVVGTFAIGDFVIMEAVLAYYGLSFHDVFPPTVVSWGNLLATNQDQTWFMTSLNPFKEIRGYLVLFPSFLLLVTVLSINFIGDALRDLLDPRLHA